MHRKLLAGFALAVVVVVAFAAPAGALGSPSPRTDRRISVSGGVVVSSGEVVNGPVVSVDGPATINGTVNDDVFVGDGRLVIHGVVTGDVLVVKGRCPDHGARSRGDVVALRGRVTHARRRARVGGDVGRDGNRASRRAPCGVT